MGGAGYLVGVKPEKGYAESSAMSNQGAPLRLLFARPLYRGAAAWYVFGLPFRSLSRGWDTSKPLSKNNLTGEIPKTA